MRNIDLVALMDVYEIYCNNKYVILVGKKIWIFLKSGEMIACIDCKSYVNKIAFLSGERLLVNGGRGTSYRLISLEDGKEIWRTPAIKKVTVYASHFAIAEGQLYAYDFHTWNGEYYLVRINLNSGSIDRFRLHGGFRTLKDITMDQYGNLFLLQTQYDESKTGRVSRNEIRQMNLTTCLSSESVFQWQSDEPTIARGFWDDPGHVITNDLYIVEVATGKMQSLVENDLDWQPPEYVPHDHWYDLDKKYACIMFDCVNVVIDLQMKKMVARYAGKYRQGCLIDGEYWMPTEKGVLKKLFPLLEDIPPRKMTYLW